MAPKSRLEPSNKQPNVYVVLLDGYSRVDALKTYYNFDNGSLISELKNVGFYHAKLAYANYPVTKLSVPSLLNMDYFFLGGEIHNWMSLERHLGLMLDGENNVLPVADALKRRGYDIFFGNYEGKPASVSQRPLVGPRQIGALDELEMEILKLTPIAEIASRFGFAIPLHYRIVQDPNVFIEQVPRNSKPRFVFAHVMSPHPPFTFRADCKLRNQVKASFNPDEFSSADQETRQDNAEEYLDQIRCLNGRLLKMVKHIVESEPEAIIVLQSDHGWGKGIKNRLSTEFADKVRFGTLCLIRIPGIRPNWLYDSISPVNIFRLILAHLDGEAVPSLLPDRSFQIEVINSNFLKSWEVLKGRSPLPAANALELTAMPINYREPG